MSEPQKLTLTLEQLEDWLKIEQVGGRRIVDPERHEPAEDPDEWMPDRKPRGDTGVPSIPPKDRA